MFRKESLAVKFAVDFSRNGMVSTIYCFAIPSSRRLDAKLEDNSLADGKSQVRQCLGICSADSSDRPLNSLADKRPYRQGRYITIFTVSI